MWSFKGKRVSNPKPSSSSPSSPPSLAPPAFPPSSSDPSSSKRNSKSSKKTVTTISKLSKRTLSRTTSAQSSTSSSSSWSCHGAPHSSSTSSHNRDSVLFGWNGAEASSSRLPAQPGSGANDGELRSDGNDSWWGRIEGEGGEELIKDGQDEHDGWETSQSGRMAFSPSGETSFSEDGRMEGSRSSSRKEAGSLGRSTGRGATSSIASSSPWSSSQGSSSLNSSLGSTPHPTSTSSLTNSSSNSSNWMPRGLRIDTDQLPPPSPSTMSSVQSFIFPSFHSSSSSSSAPKPPPVSRRPSYHVDFEDEDPFACRPIHQHERRTSNSNIPTTEPLHLSKQPQRPRITSVQSNASAQTSSPSSVQSSPNNAPHPLPLLPRPPRSSSRPKAANPSVTRITRERSSSTASMSTTTSSHSSASPETSKYISRGPPQHPAPSRPPPPIPTASIAPSSSSHSLDHSHSHSTAGSDSDAELDGVWEGFLNEVVGMKVRPGTSTMVEGGGENEDVDGVSMGRKPWEEKPLPAMPEEVVGFSVALNLDDRGSAVSGLAYLDEDEEDEIADQPFSLDASFTASDYYSSTRNNHLPTSSSLQSIMSLEISAFNFPSPPAHLPTPPTSTSIAPYHRPSHYSNLSTSSTMSSLSSVSNGSSMPVTPSFPDSVRDDTFASKVLLHHQQPAVDVEGGANVWGTSGVVSQSPGAWSGSSGEEEKRVQWREEEEDDEDTTIAWGQRERSARASEDSVRSGTEVAWGEAL